MVSFHEVRFPADISYKTIGGPEFKTEITELSNGAEKRNIAWQNARAKYQLSLEDINTAQSNNITSFFMARRGSAYGFRFKDWNDFQAKNEIIGVGNGVQTQFNLVKNYGEENFKYQRRISKPVENSVLLYVDNAQLTTGFSINYTNGIITFSTAVAANKIITASFDFDVPVRFNNDFLENEIKSFGKTKIKNLELIEIKI